LLNKYLMQKNYTLPTSSAVPGYYDNVGP
jgi:hypothetical protein